MSIGNHIRDRSGTVLLTAVLAVAVMGSNLIAKPPSAPVRVEYSRPTVSAGEEATAVLTFRALADLDRLSVSVAVDEGLEIVSQPTEATFTNVGKGEGRDLRVTIRLTAPKQGVLAVFFKTERGVRREAGATAIVFGGGNQQ
jgi:uncharacterized protein (DUF58 family)